MHSISRVSISSLGLETFAEQFQQQGTPVIITGLVNSEVDWNLDYLCQQLKTQEFLLRYYGNARYQQDKREWTSIGSGVQVQRLPFKEYAELLRSGEAHEHDIYLAKCPVANTALAKTQTLQAIDQQLGQLGLNRPASGSNLWIGPSGHVECLHYDPADGVLIQLHGSKKVVLFPPSQTANLYPYPVSVHLYRGLKLRCWFSQVYPDAPDFEAFPRLKEALCDKYEIVLNQGEALYIPAGWWHEVTALGDGMVCSVNRFWRVYPTLRAISTWTRWRVYLGSVCAVPHTLFSLFAAICKGKGPQKFQEILRML